jgi:hypothetical protein
MVVTIEAAVSSRTAGRGVTQQSSTRFPRLLLAGPATLRAWFKTLSPRFAYPSSYAAAMGGSPTLRGAAAPLALLRAADVDE